MLDPELKAVTRFEEGTHHLVPARLVHIAHRLKQLDETDDSRTVAALSRMKLPQMTGQIRDVEQRALELQRDEGREEFRIQCLRYNLINRTVPQRIATLPHADGATHACCTADSSSYALSSLNNQLASADQVGIHSLQATRSGGDSSHVAQPADASCSRSCIQCPDPGNRGWSQQAHATNILREAMERQGSCLGGRDGELIAVESCSPTLWATEDVLMRGASSSRSAMPREAEKSVDAAFVPPTPGQGNSAICSGSEITGFECGDLKTLSGQPSCRTCSASPFVSTTAQGYFGHSHTATAAAATAALQSYGSHSLSDSLSQGASSTISAMLAKVPRGSCYRRHGVSHPVVSGARQGTSDGCAAADIRSMSDGCSVRSTISRRKKDSSLCVRIVSSSEITATRLASRTASVTTITMRHGVCDVQPAQRPIDTRPGAADHALWFHPEKS